jgi:GNAT superfamily N-acetyltransferase
MRIKPLTTFEAKAVRKIFFEIFDESEDVHYNSAWRNRDCSRSLGIFSKENDLLGFSLVEGDKLAYIGIDPLYQKDKLGTTLLKRVLEISEEQRKHINLIPAEDPRLVKWYGKHGFNVVNEEMLVCGGKRITMNYHTYNTRFKRALRDGAVYK